jgi:hypothetical protein
MGSWFLSLNKPKKWKCIWGKMHESVRRPYCRSFDQNQYFKMSFNNFKFKRWKLDVLIFDFKPRMYTFTMFSPSIFYSYFKMWADSLPNKFLCVEKNQRFLLNVGVLSPNLFPARQVSEIILNEYSRNSENALF